MKSFAFITRLIEKGEHNEESKPVNEIFFVSVLYVALRYIWSAKS